MSVIDNILIDLLDDESFVRWITGTANEDEQKYWDSWLQEYPMHRELKERAEMMYYYSWELDDASDLDSELCRLNETISQTGEEFHLKLLRADQHAGSDQNKQRGKAYKISVAAAILLIVALSSVLGVYNWQNAVEEEPKNIFTTVKVDEGEQRLLGLRDGSKIQLNSGASLRYSPKHFSSSRVEVWLKGEGYFDVTHNPNGVERTFIVHTPHGNVRVLGTKFNVNTHFKTTSVFLEQGRVKVSVSDTLSNTNVSQIMHPEEQAIMSPGSQSIELHDVEVDLFTSWVKEKVEFTQTPVKKIVDAIEAKFQVSIRAEDPSLLDKRMTGAIQNPDLTSLITGLEKMMDVMIDQQGDKQFLITTKSIQ